MGRRFGSSLVSAAVAVSTLSLVVTALPATSAPLSGAVGTTLARPEQMTPADLGEDALDGLQYADPVENLDLIAPPEVDQQGGAGLSHPLTVPAGRADLAPDLELTYDSGAGNGWVGVGWDLSLGAVEIDTRWGAPLFCPRADGPTCGDVESETYVLDGDVLWPTAVRSEFEDRVAERSDWRRRTETQWERIIRHGTDTTNYWWEVTDKNGTTRFYGGTPEGQRDTSSILSDAEGNAVRWGLSAVRDISSNIMRIYYAQPDGVAVGAADAELGTGFYLRRITYTGSLATGVRDDPAYSVDFLRDADLSPVPDKRADVLVDASSGALETTSDLLRRVEVNYGDPVAGSGERNRNQLVKAWDLRYIEGAFGKSLLDRVVQRGSDDKRVARHTFDYYDEVNYRTGTYEGFDTAENWDTAGTATKDLNQTLLGPVGLSALGASETNSGDVHAYIGFNPTTASSFGSFGGAITVNGGGTGGLIEMMDINGDLLPDKVFRENIIDAPVPVPAQHLRPRRRTTFGPAKDVLGGKVKTLSTEASIGVAGGPEVHFGVSVQFSIAADVSIGEDYFTDVNNDGLPDFVSAGTVYFNSLDAQGIPEFSSDSAGTAVPIDDGTLALPDLDAFNDFEQLQRDQSPLQDVVRRWTAPFDGTIAISGAVEFDPPSGTEYDGDGVRVAIQRGNSERWAANLATPGRHGDPVRCHRNLSDQGSGCVLPRRLHRRRRGRPRPLEPDHHLHLPGHGTSRPERAEPDGLPRLGRLHPRGASGHPDRNAAQGHRPPRGHHHQERGDQRRCHADRGEERHAVGGEQVIARDFVGDVSVRKDIEVDAPSGRMPTSGHGAVGG